MEIIVGFIIFSVALIGICAYFGAKSQTKIPGQRYSTNSSYDEDEFPADEDEAFSGASSNKNKSASSEDELYGGIPFGNKRLHLSDDDDVINEFQDEFE